MTEIIRPARADEADVLTELVLRSKAHWGYSAAFMNACRAELTQTPAMLTTRPNFVLEADGQPAGLVTLDNLGDGVADLVHLFVAPEYIGRGYGRRLWQHAVETARALGYQELFVESDPNAETFYASMGMMRCGERESSAEAGRMLPLLRCPL
jgi:N-acetylglutamate synthase-like GNAT family acetyltransferase